MANLATWAATLPDMHGFTPGSVKKLLTCRVPSGDKAWVVVTQDIPGNWSFGLVQESDPNLVTIVYNDKQEVPSLFVLERYGEPTLAHLIEYLTQGHLWVYYTDEWSVVVGSRIDQLRVVDEAGLTATILTQVDDDVAEAAAGMSTLASKMAYLLRAELDRLLQDPAKDTRRFVAHASGFVGDDGNLILDIRPDVWKRYGLYSISRRLRAALPGAFVVRPVGDELDDKTLGELLPEIMLWRAKPWEPEMDANAIYDALAALPNEPVMHVGYGAHPMEVLVALWYRSDKEEIARFCAVPGVLHSSVAKPSRLYDGYVVSLLVPERDNPAFDLSDFTTVIDEHMRFFH